MLGKISHLLFDALLISTVLAGIKRSTGLTPSTKSLKNTDLIQLTTTYLELGEWVMDLSIVVMGRSSFFERRR